MPDLSATTTLAAARSHVEFVTLAAITFTSPSRYVLRVSDAYRELLGEEWLPMVRSWGTVEEALNLLVIGGSPSTASFTLFNNKPVGGRDRLSDLLASPLNTGTSYEFAFAEVTVYRVPAAGASGDEVTVGTFYLEEPTEIGDTTFTLRMTDESLVLDQKRDVATTITREILPDCDASIEGLTLPTPIGRLTSVRCYPIVAGQVTTLDGSLTDVATSLTLADATHFAEGDTIMVDAEHITLGTKSGATFAGCARAANTTTASEHDDESIVFEVRSTYRFSPGEAISADYPIGAISNVKVNGGSARTSPTTDVGDPDIIAGKRIAVIEFTAADLLAFHTYPLGPVEVTVANADTATLNGAGSTSTARSVAVPSGYEAAPPSRRTAHWRVSKTSGTGTVSAWTVKRKYVGGAYVTIASGADANLPAEGDDAREYDNLAADYFLLSITYSSATNLVVRLAINSYTVETESGGADTSTAARVIGEVTCDIDGILDDLNGGITGWPRALIENPVDATRVLHVKRYGARGALGSSWATSRALLGPYKWALLFSHDGAVPWSEFRELVERQSRCRLFLDGGRWELVHTPDAPAADLTLDYDRDVWADMPASVSRTERTRMFNSILAKSAYDYAAGSYTRTARVEDLVNSDSTDRIETTLELPWVQDATTAAMLAAFWLAQWKRLRWVVNLVAWQNVLARAKCQHIAFTNHPILDAHGGSALVFRIAGKSYLLDAENPARIQLEAVEANR